MREYRIIPLEQGSLHVELDPPVCFPSGGTMTTTLFGGPETDWYAFGEEAPPKYALVELKRFDT